MIDPELILLFLFARGAGGGGGRQQPSGPQPRRPRQPQQATKDQAWAHAIAATAAVSPTIAAGLGRAAVMEGAGPPTTETVKGLLTAWDHFRAEAERHKMPGVQWDERDLLWYATLARIRPDLLEGTGQRAALTTVSIIRAHEGDADVFDAVDRATWVATGNRLPPPAPQRAAAPAPAPAPAPADRDQPLRVVPGPLPGAADAAER